MTLTSLSLTDSIELLAALVVVQLTFVSILLLLCGTEAQSAAFMNYYMPHEKFVDYSSALTCYIVFGTLTPIDSSATDHELRGYKCEYTTDLWTGDDLEALDFCTSRHPYHIIKAESKNVGGATKTTCAFQINLFCKPDWWQINGICYKIEAGLYRSQEVDGICNATEPTMGSIVAEYYSDSLSIYFSEMFFGEAWIRVSHIKDKLDHAPSDLAIFALDSAFKYDVKPGTVVPGTPITGYPALCQYTPPRTMAEVNYIASIYNEIYPVMMTDSGPSLGSTNYQTIEQVAFQGNQFEKFGTSKIRDTCTNIGNILNVHSFPVISIKEEWEKLKGTLNNHRFYMTSAFKDDGCSIGGYKEFDENSKQDVPIYRSGDQEYASNKEICNAFSFVINKHRRHPAQASFRAPVLCSLHAFSFEYVACPDGWHTFMRNGVTPFCHYVYKGEPVSFGEAKDYCKQQKSALSGFESAKEYTDISKHAHGPHLDNQHAWILGHYYLGGSIPCSNNCNGIYIASWNEGVSRNTEFLNNFNHAGFDWSAEHGNSIIAYRVRGEAFHTHNTEWPYPKMWFICGMYPKMVPKMLAAKSVKNTG